MMRYNLSSYHLCYQFHLGLSKLPSLSLSSVIASIIASWSPPPPRTHCVVLAQCFLVMRVADASGPYSDALRPSLQHPTGEQEQAHTKGAFRSSSCIQQVPFLLAIHPPVRLSPSSPLLVSHCVHLCPSLPLLLSPSFSPSLLLSPTFSPSLLISPAFSPSLLISPLYLPPFLSPLSISLSISLCLTLVLPHLSYFPSLSPYITLPHSLLPFSLSLHPSLLPFLSSLLISPFLTILFPSLPLSSSLFPFSPFLSLLPISPLYHASLPPFPPP